LSCRRIGLFLLAGLALSAPSGPALAQDTVQERAQAGAQAGPPSLIASDVFAAEGAMSGPVISPDGSTLAFRQLADGRTYLTVRPLDGGEAFSKALPEKSELNWFRWAGNDKLLFSASTLMEYRGRRAATGEFQQRELYVIDLATRRARFAGPTGIGPIGDNVIHVDLDGKFAIVSARESIYKYPEVFRIDLENGDSEKIISEQHRIWDWVTDTAGVVRMGLSYRRSSTLIYYRSSGNEDFRRIDKVKDKDVVEGETEPLLDGFVILAGSDDAYVLSSGDTGLFALHRFNLLTREIGEQVFAVPGHDVASFSVNQEGALMTARYTDTRDRIKWFDTELGEYHGALEAALGGKEAWITSYSRDRRKMVVFTQGPRDPGSYYLFDADAGTLDRFGGINDRIDPALMSATTSETYTARDGTVIPAYLTLPNGREPKGLPLIIMPHGGPYGVRDTLDFDMEVQFLANRGYAVLQPNFRGSGGYGKAFVELGEGQIGRAMQDDLDDGMDWLVERGIVDPARVCIVGASYGGYAALWGVTRNPERYRCAASFAGVTDFDRQLRYANDFFKHRYARNWRETVRGEDGFNMDDVSPITTVDRLTRPVLLVHGEEDSVVPFDQFVLYRDRLEDVGADAEFVTYEKEGHGFTDAKNRQDWLDRLGAFLQKHNPS
jgi:dipeptidyl aminopeptidase/acylaminoacyl peptidase